MAGKRRHWKEKNGRFWARVSIPVAMRPFFTGKTQLAEALGGDLRIADMKHAAAVARLQGKIEQVRRSKVVVLTPSAAEKTTRELSFADHEQAVWLHYTAALAADDTKRATMAKPADIAVAHEAVMRRIDAGEGDPSLNPVGMFNIATEYELMASERHFYAKNRAGRLAALRLDLASGETRFVESLISDYLKRYEVSLTPGSLEWHGLADKLMRAEIAALELIQERDQGIFGGSPIDPIVRPPSEPVQKFTPVPLMDLFKTYIIYKQASGKHRDGGANWEYALQDLIVFLSHDDAHRIKKRNLLDWRDGLIASGKSTKTVADKYLAAVRAVLNWALENDKLPTNEGADVHQEVPKKVRSREAGFTNREAVNILQTSLSYMPTTC